ncbi:hypothetical protein I6N98_09600 [Spongiibacter nanhainus]|uniref:Uncharacterized protein n=1 Tax=Spongiibacter nanhainus TaxID=2794344 RepID=A0A7T4QXK7_9GAMM|nr:hypothetical protein [Spongiibacter nanhainus]QQD16659.1 hypothetical protein I6N98_09600 [Spongiibacter nanhainus]
MNVVVERANEPRMDLPERKRDDVMPPRPTTGDHKKIVRAACAEALVRNHETLKELAKI